MYQTINTEGLRRLAHFELDRLNPKNKEEARRHLTRRLGVYDREGLILEKGLASYYGMSL